MNITVTVNLKVSGFSLCKNGNMYLSSAQFGGPLFSEQSVIVFAAEVGSKPAVVEESLGITTWFELTVLGQDFILFFGIFGLQVDSKTHGGTGI